MKRGARLLRAATLVMLVASWPAPAVAQAGPSPEILVLAPVSGSTMFDNPFQLKGRVEGDVERGLQLRSATAVGFVRVTERRFRFPVYLWADALGQVLPLALHDPGAAPGQEPLLALDYGLDAYEPELLERELVALDQVLASNPAAGWQGGLELAQRLLRAGHPIFASTVLHRLPELTGNARPSAAKRAEALLLWLEVAILLGHDRDASRLLASLIGLELEVDRKVLARGLGEKLFVLSDLALILGEPLHLASDLLEAGNAYFLEAGLLPRRLLKGY